MHIEFDNLTRQRQPDTLTPFLDKPVVDATATKGAFKIAMDLPMGTMFAMMQNTMRNSGFAPPGQGFDPGLRGGRGDGPGGGPRGGPQAGCFDPSALAAGGTDTSNAAIFQAVQKLGLRLQPKRRSTRSWSTIWKKRRRRTNTVGAVYDRLYFVDSRKNGRS
jgi:uncharacterized protein (TIGR03435 family)